MFSKQIRAARALINISQDELSEASGVGIATLRRIEAGDEGTTHIQEKIKRALHARGAVFTSDGVAFQQFPVFHTFGTTHEEAYLALLNDAHEHLLTVKNPELLIKYADDRVSPPSVNAKYREMRAQGIAMRQMIQEGNEYIIGPLEEYRYIPKASFANRVTLIYGDRIANETADVHQGLIRLDALNADIERKTFNLLWDVLKQPERTVADERF